MAVRFAHSNMNYNTCSISVSRLHFISFLTVQIKFVCPDSSLLDMDLNIFDDLIRLCILYGSLSYIHFIQDPLANLLFCSDPYFCICFKSTAFNAFAHFFFSFLHRIRIKTEEKAKVVVSV